MNWKSYPKNLNQSTLKKLKRFRLSQWLSCLLSLSLSPNRKRSNLRNTSSRDKYILFVILSSYTNLSLEYTFLILYLTISGLPITLSRHVSIRITDDITHSVFSFSILPPFSLTDSPDANMQQLRYFVWEFNQNRIILFHSKKSKARTQISILLWLFDAFSESRLNLLFITQSPLFTAITATK